MQISVIGPLPKSQIPQHLLSSSPGSLWLFASSRVVLIQAWVAVIHISTKSTVRLSLTDYNESPLDGKLECGCCLQRLLLAIQISPPAHAITSPSAPPLTLFALTIPATFSA